MRTFLIPSLLLLAGCPKSGSPELPTADSEPIRLTLAQVPFQDLCISRIPAEKPLKAKDLEHVERSVTFLEQGRFNYALTALAQVTDTHPGVDALKASTMMLMGQVEEAAVLHEKLVIDYPDDGCLLMAASLNNAALGNLEDAVMLAKRSTEADPEDANAALLHASLAGTVDPDSIAAVLDAVFAKFPEHPGAAWLVAMVRLDAGDMEGAMEAFKVARTGDLPVDAFLMQIHYQRGDVGAYVAAAAAEPGMPLVGREAILEADDKTAAFYTALGGEPGHALVANLETTMGTLRCELFVEQAPITVSNFVGLATGTLPWTDPNTGQPGTGALYTDIVFHRVIPEFMVQVGDPLGNGTGGPGYAFMDEIHPSLRFDRPGLLAMANSGPGTNGSQFFVTEIPTPHLTGKHTIFGACDSAAQELVKQIARVPAEASRPTEDVLLKSIRIESVAPVPVPEPPVDEPVDEPEPSGEVAPAAVP